MTLDQSRASVALLLLLPMPSLGVAASMWWWPGTTHGMALFVLSKIWVVLLPLGWRLFVERARLSGSPPRAGGFGPAIALGAGTAVMIVAAYAITRRLGIIDPAMVAERAARTGLNQPTFYLVGALYWITLNSLMEEYVWRWFCFRQCEVLFGGFAPVWISALGFTLHHILALAGQFPPAATALGSFGVFCGGTMWSWLYLRYRSVWPCYASHAVVDIPIFVIGYYLIFRTGANG